MIIIIAVLITALVTFMIVILKNNEEDEMSNEDYVAMFTCYVNKIDNRQPKWIEASLRELKRGYTYYSDNPRAMSTLELLQEASEGKRPEVVKFIMSCNQYRKKSLL